MKRLIISLCLNRSSIKTKESILDIYSLLSIILIFFTPLGNVKAQSISVDAGNDQQFISMMGGDMERSGGNFLNAYNQQEIINWCVKDIPMDTWRVRYDKLQEMEEGVKDFSVYDGDVLAMKMILDLNPEVKFFATMKSDYGGYNEDNRNNFPVFIYDYWYDETDGNYYGDRSFDAQKYSVFLADYLEFMEDSGVPITYLSTSKEMYWTMTTDKVVNTISALKSELTSRGMNMPLIIDPGAWSITEAIRTIDNYVDAGINDEVIGYCSHDYWESENKTWEEFVDKANTNGKFAYNDETEHGGMNRSTYEPDFEEALYVYKEKAETYAAGLEGELMFEIWPRGVNEVDDQGFWGKAIFFNKSVAYRMRAYYIMKEFMIGSAKSHYVNSTLNALDSDVHIMAFKKDGQLSVWVINDSETDYSNIPLAINNSNLLEVGMNVKNTIWNEDTQREGEIETLTIDQKDMLTASLPAKSIISFSFNGEYAIQHFYQVNDETWNSGDLVKLNENDNIKLGPNFYDVSLPGTWSWTGPNGFSASTREITLNSLSPQMSGEYVLTFMNENGVGSELPFEIQLSCQSSPALTPYYRVNNGEWVSSGEVNLNTGDDLDIGPHPISGTWSWSGPNEFSSDNREISFNKMNFYQKGTYEAVYTSNEGCTESIDFNVNVNCEYYQNITFYSNVNDAGWNNNTILNLNLGDKIEIGPQSNSNEGLWYYEGPNGFIQENVRPITIENIADNQFGNYTLIRKTPYGCETKVNFEINNNACNNTVSLIEAECYNDMSGITKENSANGIEDIGAIKNGDWAMYTKIDLSNMKSVNVNASSAGTGGMIEVRLDALDGTLIGTVDVGVTEGWDNWDSFSANINQVNGEKDIYLVFKGSNSWLYNIDYFGFSEDEILVTALEEQTAQISIYPNPSTGVFNLSKVSEYRVTNALGTEILFETDSQIDLSVYPKGVYYLEVNTIYGVEVYSLLKE